MIDTPKNRKAAMASKHWQRWREAEKREWADAWKMGCFKDHKIDEIAPRHRLHYILWQYKAKRTRDKARLCLNGRQQDPSTYDNVYSPTVRMTSSRILMNKAAEEDWDLFADDASQAFLNAPRPADKPVFALYPAGFEKPGHCLQMV